MTLNELSNASNPNINLEATTAEVKIHTYMSHSYPTWIDYSGAILGHSPLLSLKESKTDGVMMGQDKTRLNQV